MRVRRYWLVLGRGPAVSRASGCCCADPVLDDFHLRQECPGVGVGVAPVDGVTAFELEQPEVDEQVLGAQVEVVELEASEAVERVVVEGRPVGGPCGLGTAARTGDSFG